MTSADFGAVFRACALATVAFFGALFFGAAFFGATFFTTAFFTTAFFLIDLLVVAFFLAAVLLVAAFRVDAFLAVAFLGAALRVPGLFLAVVAFLRVATLPDLALLELELLLAAGLVVVFFAFLPEVDFRLFAFFANVLSTFRAATGYPRRFAY